MTMRIKMERSEIQIMNNDQNNNGKTKPWNTIKNTVGAVCLVLLFVFVYVAGIRPMMNKNKSNNRSSDALGNDQYTYVDKTLLQKTNWWDYYKYDDAIRGTVECYYADANGNVCTVCTKNGALCAFSYHSKSSSVVSAYRYLFKGTRFFSSDLFVIDGQKTHEALASFSVSKPVEIKAVQIQQFDEEQLVFTYVTIIVSFDESRSVVHTEDGRTQIPFTYSVQLSDESVTLVRKDKLSSNNSVVDYKDDEPYFGNGTEIN